MCMLFTVEAVTSLEQHDTTDVHSDDDEESSDFNMISSQVNLIMRKQ